MTHQINARRFRGATGIVRADANANQILAELQQTFAAFRAERDAEIAELRRGQQDVVRTEKIERINADLSALQGALEQLNAQVTAARIGGGAADAPTVEAQAHASAFNQLLRRGVDAGLRELEVSARLTTSSDPDGGYVVPDEVDRNISRVLGTMSAMRQIANVVQVGTSTYKRLVNQGGATSGWVGEQQPRPETSTPTLREIALVTAELYANPSATQQMLDDAWFNVEQWLADEVAIEFAEQEAEAFITGNGVNKPRGLLSYTAVANASYSWGGLGYVATGVAAALSDSTHNGVDALFDLYYALKSGYRNNATWLMSDAVMGAVRKLKDGDGNYIWAPPSSAAELSTVMGKTVVTDDNMPIIDAGNFPIAFGDFRRGYTIADRMGARILRDPYTNKPFVNFYTTKRVGGGITNFEAIKLLKVAAS